MVGCDKGEGAYARSVGPAPKLVAVRMGANASTCTPQPGDASCFTNVSQQPLIMLTFDRPLASSSESRDNYLLVSGSSGNIAFKRVRVDPVERAVVLAIADTSVTGPDARLAGNTEYRLLIKSSDDPRNQLASFEGARLEGQLVVRFTTRAAAGDEENRLDPAPVDACESIKILSSKCSGERCHGANNVPPAMGLSLVTYEAMSATAIGQRSSLVQTAQTPPPGVGAPSADFPYGMAIIEKGSSARSFLLYKILIDKRRTATATGSAFTVEDAPGIPGSALTSASDPLVQTANELHRRIPGSEMPPEFLAGGAPSGFGPLSLSEVRTLRRWIDDGAPPCTSSVGDAGTDASTDGATDASTDALSDVSDTPG